MNTTSQLDTQNQSANTAEVEPAITQITADAATAIFSRVTLTFLITKLNVHRGTPYTEKQVPNALR